MSYRGGGGDRRDDNRYDNRRDDRREDSRRDDNRRDDHRRDDHRRDDQYRDDQRGYRDDGRGGGSQYGSTYSTNSGSSSGGHRGGHGGGGRGNYQGGGRGGHDLSDQMSDMSMGGRGGGRGGENMYSQQGNRGGQSRVPRSHGDNLGDLAGSAQHPRAPVPKKNLAHTKQKFAPRPDGWVFDKKAVGTKTELFTNHVLVTLPTETVHLFCYNIEVFENKKVLNKREEAGPIFHAIARHPSNRTEFPLNATYIFNDVNMLWTTFQLPRAEGRIVSSNRKNSIGYKFTSRVDFGTTIREDQDSQILATLVDAIATATAREPPVQGGRSHYIVFKRCMFMIQDRMENEHEVLDFPLTVPLQQGVDARVGISIAVRLNLRAGMTACFDVAHTLFNRPGYPLVLLFCELLNSGTISREQFENEWDARLRDAKVTADNRATMSSILKKMRLRYSFDAAVRIGEGGKPTDPSVFAYGGKTLKQFKFHQLTTTSADKTFFVNDEGREVSVAQYFLEANNIRLRYPNLPLLQKKPSKQNNRFIAYPMELVSYFEDCQRYEGATSTDLKADLIRYTSYEAPQRLALLQRVIAQEQISDVPPPVNNNDRYMQAVGLNFSKEMLSVNATVLPAPTLLYGEGSTFTDVNHEGEWEAVTHKPIRKVLEGSVYVRNPDPNAPKIKKRLLGSILEVGSPRSGKVDLHYDPGCYHRLMVSLDNSGQPVAWENKAAGQAAIMDVYRYCQTDDKTSPYSVVQYFESLKMNIDNKYKESEDEVLIPFVVVIYEVRCSTIVQSMPEVFNDYNFIKFQADNSVGIHTQGILLRNLSEIGMEAVSCKLTRLMIEKMLGKVGTTHRMIERSTVFKPWMLLTDPEKPTLILGVDVSHPSTRELEYHDVRKLSAAAVVGNIDLDCTEYRSSSRIQHPGEERIVRFRSEIVERISDFIQSTGKRPHHIVVYRDGFSEGEFQRTLHEERIDVEEACIAIAKDFRPTITYIVSTKRHHTRFFLKDTNQGTKENGYNILPGTLVEDKVTTKEYYDYFLCSQSGEKGVARPTHYYVLHDTWQPGVSYWPVITYALTYLFCRTTSTVAQPAPLLYAHLAAKRAKESLDGAWSTSILKNENLNIDNVANVDALTRSINQNRGLDGMTYV